MLINTVIIISLFKDYDRRNNAIKQCKKINIHNIIIIEAIDGKKENIDMHIACTLSHIKAWKYVLNNNIKNYIIVEDDIIFSHKWNNIIDDLIIPDINWDIILFGYFGLSNINKNYSLIEKILFNLPYVGNELYKNPNSKKINNNFFIPESPLGLHCYTINDKSIKLLINYFKKPFNLPDVMLNLYSRDLNIIAINPCLAFQDIKQFNSSLINHSFLLPLFNLIIYDEYIPLGWRLSHYGKKIYNIPINGFTYIYIIIIMIFLILITTIKSKSSK